MVLGVNPMSQGGYLAGVLLFLLAWFVALGGLIASQIYCEEPEEVIGGGPTGTATFLTGSISNNNCSDTFQLPWFVWALCFIPAIIALSTAFAPKFLRGSTATFFAVVSVLCILMTHSFHELRHQSGNLSSSYRRSILAALIGFALLAAFGLLMLLLDALLSFGQKDHHHDRIEGGVVHEPKYTHTHTTTVPVTHATNV